MGHLLAVLVLVALAWTGRAEEDFRAAIDAQRKALTGAVTQRDAAGVARIFTSEAKFMPPGFETVTGREAIQRLWQAALGGGFVKGLDFAPTDLAGDGQGLLAETGTVTTLDSDGKAKNRSRYLLVWKREGPEWRIHRDIVNSEAAAAPTVDRVGFPKDYQKTFKVLGVPARTSTSPALIMTAYGNDLAASVTNAEPLRYPDGSVILMEFAEARKDSEGRPLLDETGQVRKGEVQHVDVMRRAEGFGEAYGANRSGEWEFAGYHLDGSYSTEPANSASCAQCHQKAGAARDFVFPLKLRLEAGKSD